MKQNYKYDPEDLESLLLHKQFHELSGREGICSKAHRYSRGV
jgi:hypothetical protein